MTLHLDVRQRAMLKEMGVQVWLPGTTFAVQSSSGAARADATPVPTPAAPVMPARVAATPAVAPLHAPAPVPVPVPDKPASVPGATVAPAEVLPWPALVSRVAACQACGLHAGRAQCVLRADAPAVQADWLVVVDPPEEQEERSRAPIAADAAVLLDNMLKAVGVSRGVAGPGGAYVTPVVKCRAPHATMVTEQDLQQCLAHLRAEIALVRPRLVLLMGRFAQQLVQMAGSPARGLPLDKLRGTVYRFEGLPAIVTYHPKILLRSSPNKAKAWADLCLALDTLETTAAT